VAIFSWVAQQERDRLIERTKAGQARARAQGKTIGRPKRVTPEIQAKIDRLVADDLTIREISMAVHLPKDTVHRAVRDAKRRRESPVEKGAA
jgi:putative DNA-invertase from lambdoid prophage Rac